MSTVKSLLKKYKNLPKIYRSTKVSRIAAMAAAIPASRNLTSTPNNSTILYTGTTGSYNIWNPPHSNMDNLIEYINLLYSIVGIDIKFDEFQNMSESEKKSFIREIKIEKIINKDDNNRS